jgi:DNA-binding GntR family transcriptional regulator
MPEKEFDSLLLERQTTQESVVDNLRTLILSRKLKPGERLVQNDLAQEFGVSRTPIREALHNLASEGLVSFSAYKGATVADFSLVELEGIYSVRAALEGYAAYLAAQHITEGELQQMEALLGQTEEAFLQSDHLLMLKLNREFHAILYNASRQSRLYELIINHLDLSDMYRRLYFTVEHLYANTITEHKELLEILRRGDCEGAEQHTRFNLQQTATALIDFLQETQE